MRFMQTARITLLVAALACVSAMPPVSAQAPRASATGIVTAPADAATLARWLSDAFALLQRGEHAAARDAYTRALALAPAHAAAHYYLARALDGLGQGEAARAEYAEAARLGPDTEEGRIAREVLADIAEDRASLVDGCW